MGNCLDRTLSDDGEAAVEEENSSSNNNSGENEQRSHHRHSRSRRNNYNRLSESSSSLSSVGSTNRDRNNNLNYLSASIASLMGSTAATARAAPNDTADQHRHHRHHRHHHHHSHSHHNNNHYSNQLFYLSPSVQRTGEQLTEEEQLKLLKRVTIIQQLPTAQYDGGSGKKNKECVICMVDFELNDTIKYLPCMHTFHQACIDNWLIRSLVCPSCIEPVDSLIYQHMAVDSTE